jgi:hypothetical protein
MRTIRHTDKQIKEVEATKSLVRQLTRNDDDTNTRDLNEVFLIHLGELEKYFLALCRAQRRRVILQ